MKNFRIKIICLVLLGCAAFWMPANTQAAAYSPQSAGTEFYNALKTLDSIYLNDADYRKLVDAAIKAAFEELDPYTAYMTVEDYKEYLGIGQVNKVGIGVSMRINGAGEAVITHVYSGSPAEKAGIVNDDIICKVNGNSLDGRKMDEMRELILGEQGTSVVLSVLRGGEEKNITVVRGSFEVPTVQKKDISSLLEGADNNKVAYVELSTFISVPENTNADTGASFKRIIDEIKKSGVKNLILDLRYNLGGDSDALVDVARLLVKEGVIFTMVDNRGNKQTFSSYKKDMDFNLMVLVNEETASSAEILASAIKESGAGTIIGSRTYGKGVGQVVVPTADGSHYMKITAFDVLSRNGGRIQGVGVEPDIHIASPPYVIADRAIDKTADIKDILALRQAVSYIGYDVDITNTAYDDKLTAVVAKLQEDFKLPILGVCTFETMEAINRHVSDKYLKHDEALEAAYKLLTKN